jgi:exopolysaccharide biosynthesis protein
MKKFMSMILAGFLCFSPICANPANAETYFKDTMIHQQSNSTQLAGGIRYENRQLFTDYGWLNLNIAYIDLSDPNVKVDTIFSNEGSSKKASVNDMVREHNPSVAINGDFFEGNNGYYPLGLAINNGKLVSTPMLDQSLPALYIDSHNQPFLNFFNWTLNGSVNGGAPFKIYYINKGSSNYGGIVLYDHNWSGNTIGNAKVKELTEVVVSNGIVSKILINSPSVPLNENEYELILKGTDNYLTQNIKVGDKINLDLNSNPGISTLKAGIGGGQILLKDAQKVHQGISIRGKQPRTAVGYTKDGTEMIFLTIDGRNKSFKGVSENTLADIMLDLGAYEALNLDGGGSTTMAINPYRNFNAQIVNHPSDGNPRRVINSFAAFNTAEAGKINKMEFSDSDKKIFQNLPYSFEMIGFDKNGNVTEINSEKIDLDTDDISFNSENNTFTANEIGRAKLKAVYKNDDDIKAQTKIEVLKPLKYLFSNNKDYQVPRGSSTPISDILGTVKGINEDGFIAEIDITSLDVKLLGSGGHIDGDNFISNTEKGASALVYSIGGASNYVNLSTGYDKQVINEFENLDGLVSSAYPETTKVKLGQSPEMVNGFTSLSLNYDFTLGNETRAAYIDFNSKPVVVMEEIDALGLWVYGNESGHWLRAEIKDVNGKTYKLDFANNIDWKGWKSVKAELPVDISYPITLSKIYLVETNPAIKDQGQILLDNFETLNYFDYTGPNLPERKEFELTSDSISLDSSFSKYVFSPGIKSENEVFKESFVPDFENRLSKFDIAFYSGDLLESFTNNISTNLTLGNRKQIFPKENTLFFMLDNKNGGFRASDSSQWKWFLNNIKNLMDKNILIVTSKPVLSNKSFDDPLEKNLFIDTLEEKFSDNNKIFVVSESNRNYATKQNGVTYLEFDKTPINESSNPQNINALILEDNNGELKFNFEPIYKDISFVYVISHDTDTKNDKKSSVEIPEEKSEKSSSTDIERAIYRINVGEGSKLNVRSSAGGDIIDKLEHGTKISLTGKSQDSDKYHWVEITYNSKKGWIADEFITHEN